MKRVFSPAKKKVVLMIHDDDLVAKVYREHLQNNAGLKIEVAGDGEMLDRTGLELCVKIREMPINCATPVGLSLLTPILDAARNRL